MVKNSIEKSNRQDSGEETSDHLREIAKNFPWAVSAGRFQEIIENPVKDDDDPNKE